MHLYNFVTKRFLAKKTIAFRFKKLHVKYQESCRINYFRLVIHNLLVSSRPS
uniref:Uncharacterized protein n=1 Tax=Arundo donax TaxID=35708 RepID=A0A0A9DYZ5_ARUDO